MIDILFHFRRIMVMPRYSTQQSTGEKVKSLAIFVQCDPENEGSSWSCQGHAKITLINHKEDNFTRSKCNILSFLCWLLRVLSTQCNFNGYGG